MAGRHKANSKFEFQPPPAEEGMNKKNTLAMDPKRGHRQFFADFRFGPFRHILRVVAHSHRHGWTRIASEEIRLFVDGCWWFNALKLWHDGLLADLMKFANKKTINNTKYYYSV